MAINRTPVLKRCRQLGIDPIVLGYTKESKKQPKQRRPGRTAGHDACRYRGRS